MFDNPLILVVVVLAIAFVAGKVFYKVDHEVEARRRAAGVLAGHLRAKGSKLIADFLTDYSVGALVAMGEKIHKAGVELEQHPEDFEKEFDAMVDRAIAARAAAAAASAPASDKSA
jgi:hypothetical protein